ncbi:MAG: HAD family phosphatase [Planctomycetes bacterium]|jgi:putative hydrolase of the HAD superfamily|nr:HAD family phosphatase [Planctomycetota bacterium]
MEPRAVVFDIGNVVLDFDFSILLGKAARRFGRPPEEIARRFQDARVQRDFECGLLSPRDFHRAVSAAFPRPLDYGEFVELWNGIFSETPGTAELLRALSGRVRLLAASNTNALHLDHIRRRFPVLSLFDSVVASCEIGACKPEPAMYQEVLRRAGESPSRVVFVDDLEANVEGAVRAGMTGILFRGAPDLRRRLTQIGALPPAA